jgi:triphosphoribosyl-dephospho-CoA synthase
MATLDDTCLLHRGGTAGLALVQHGAGRVLEHGGSADSRGSRLLHCLDAEMSRLSLSPGGGGGDLLAATLFLDRVTVLLPAG